MNVMTPPSTLTRASTQWMSRPDDQRFGNLDDLLAFTRHQREISRSAVVPSRAISAAPIDGEDDPSRRQLVILDENQIPSVPTHWAFGQLAQRVGAPAGYLRELPSDIVADALNWGLFTRSVEDTGVLFRREGLTELAAVTGPNYGRVWNADVAAAVRHRFGDGVTGDFTAPGIFGKALDPNDPEEYRKQACFFASDRDMFIFMCDEKNRIEIPNRRNGRSGSLARGFFLWNSEVGSKTLGIATFLFDFVCANRIVWGAHGYEEISFRHSASAPTRWIEELAPAIESYAEKSTQGIRQAVIDAQAARIDDDKVDEFLRKRFTKGQAQGIKLAHMAEEDRPIESLWDVTVGATAYAKGLKHQDDRVLIEREAGKVMALAK